MLFVLAATPACSAAQRRAVGGTVFALGAVTTVAGCGFVLDQCGSRPEYEQEWCREHHHPPNEHEGSRVIAVGLGTVVLGGIIYLTATHLKPAKPGSWHFSRSADEAPTSPGQGTMKTPLRSSVAEMYVRPVLPFLPVASRHETARN